MKQFKCKLSSLYNPGKTIRLCNMDLNVDEEWSKYLSCEMSKMSLNDTACDSLPIEQIGDDSQKQIEIPECEELYISTKTKVLFLNQEIDINNVFWEIPILEYWKPSEGVIKKQMKIISKSNEDLDVLQERLKGEYYYTENIIKQINNPEARRIKFKDERKITIGMSKKDIMNSRGKVKNAFYNCFAIILRFLYEGSFREIHVKIFNTGKMEIPGVVNKAILETVKDMILRLLVPLLPKMVEFVEKDVNNNVLINSNFNCGFYINRDILYSTLKNDYGIDTAFDPCSYPGVKCKFYFNHEIGFDKELQDGKIMRNDGTMKMSELIENKKYTEVSFMIFRTGSCLIIGNCCEDVLMYIYEFIRDVLRKEYHRIVAMNETPVVKNKVKKVKRKMISRV